MEREIVKIKKEIDQRKFVACKNKDFTISLFSKKERILPSQNAGFWKTRIFRNNKLAAIKIEYYGR